MDRLHKKGMLGDPVGKAKSVALTEEGLQRSGELFINHFAKSIVRWQYLEPAVWHAQLNASILNHEVSRPDYHVACKARSAF